MLESTWVRSAACAFAAAVFATFAVAQDTWPSRPIKLVVPYPPGSTADTVARLIGQAVGEVLKQPIVVDNRAGASGNIGAQAVARAAPDGYTMLMTAGSIHGINSALFRKLPYDPVADFTPVTQLTTNSFMLIVNKDLPVSTVKELVALSKREAGKLNIGAGASSSQFAGEMFKIKSGANLTYIGYKGNAQALTDLIAGQVHVMVSDMSGGTASYKGGLVKGLATTGLKRSRVTPELPTMQEAGVPGYEFTGWVGIVAPVGTPRAIVDKLSAAIRVGVAKPEVTQALTMGGAEIVLNSPEQFGAVIKEEISRAIATAQAANIQPE